MIPDRLLPLSAGHVTPGTATDTYGDLVDDWGYSATTVTIRVRIEQLATSETNDVTRDTAEARWRLFTNVDLTHRDRLVIDGVTYEVLGVPDRVYAVGGVHHVEAVVRMVT